MAQSEFWKMTPREFSNACNGYNDKINRGLQNSWEQARLVATFIVNVNSQKKKYKPQELVKFPWESESKELNEELDIIKERRKWRTGH